jgi:hypothetical protein
MPFFGMHTVQGDGGKNFGPGPRIGILGGGYLREQVSLNAEVALDWTNPNVSGADIKMFVGDLALSPLFHYRRPEIELVVGPKLGLFYGYAYIDSSFFGGSTSTARGWTAGLNAAALFPISGSASAGLLFNYQARELTENCVTAMNRKLCSSSANGAQFSATHFISITGAFLF